MPRGAPSFAGHRVCTSRWMECGDVTTAGGRVSRCVESLAGDAMRRAASQHSIVAEESEVFELRTAPHPRSLRRASRRSRTCGGHTDEQPIVSPASIPRQHSTDDARDRYQRRHLSRLRGVSLRGETGGSHVAVPARGAHGAAAHFTITSAGFPFSSTYVASSAGLPRPTFLAAWTVRAGTNRTSPALSVTGGLP